MPSRALDRVTAFTDAAVAIALTLLVLPLVDTAQQAADTPVREIVRVHGGDVLAFVISFFVVMLFWRAHRRLFEPVRHLDEPLLTLNSFWLLGVVFLPVPTAVLTFEADVAPDAAVLYLGNLLFVSVMGLALSAWLRLRPRLVEPEQSRTVRRHLRRAALMSALIAVATVLAVPFGSLALLVLVVLPALRLVTRPPPPSA